MELRKANVRRFGAGWIKPPGVGKTLQGMAEEKAEREEQEAVAERYEAVPLYCRLSDRSKAQGVDMMYCREQAALEAAMAREQAVEEARLQEVANGTAGDDESGDGERDLDDDIPDADEGQDGWVDLDGEDGLPREEGDGDYAEGMEVDAGAGGRDLDDDVPEAGSYQHTDTDLEDDSDGSDWIQGRESLPAMGRVSNGSGVLGSSVFGSSPLVHAQRGGGRRGGNLADRRQGAEN